MMKEYEGGTRRKKARPMPEPESEDFSGEEVRLVCAARLLPHPDKVKTGGEDAYFISRSGRGACGVADGVGSWVMDGVNPAEFPRQLVASLEAAVTRRDWANDEDGLRGVLAEAHAAATAPGSATVILAAAGAGGIVHVANLGDCGVRVVRDGECSFASTDMLHDYNTPFQLGRVEEDDDDEDVDTPDDAELYEIEVAPGDVMVLASDGLFDNLFDEEIANIVDALLRGQRDERTAQVAAAALADAATAKVRDKDSRTPWVAAAARAGELPPWQRLRPRGGKVDDITVIVALVNKG
jgi:protein phosphatase PTC7